MTTGINLLSKFNHVANIAGVTPCNLFSEIGNAQRVGTKKKKPKVRDLRPFKKFLKKYPELFDGTITDFNDKYPDSIAGSVRRAYAEGMASTNKRIKAQAKKLQDCYKKKKKIIPPEPPNPPEKRNYPRLRNWIIDYEPKPSALGGLIDNWSSFGPGAQADMTDMAEWVRNYKRKWEDWHGTTASNYY